MRFLTIVSTIIFLALSCKDKATSPLRKRKANKILMGSQKTDSAQWRLVKKFDPYNNGHFYFFDDSTNYHYLTLFGNGSFKEFDKDNKSKGKWYLNKEKKKLALVYAVRNGIEIGESLQDIFFRYQIDSLYKDTLILSIQGRHGMVKHFYQGPMLADTIQDTLKGDSLIIQPEDSLILDSTNHPSKN